jgi:hypothetical protein
MSIGDEIVSPAMQKELDERIAAAGGDIQAVRHELEDELHRLEAEQAEAENPAPLQTQIALVLAEIEYLDVKAKEAGAELAEKHEGLVERLRNWLRGR